MMPKLKQERIFQNKSHLLVFVVVFFGYSCLFSPPFIEADIKKEIKTHSNATPKAIGSAGDLKAKAEAYNKEAIALFEEGRYAEAQELWEKAIKLMEHPLAGHIDFETMSEDLPFAEVPELPVANDETLEASPIAEQYQAGLSLLERKEYGEARKIFQEIDATQPDYRNTKRYLIVIDELLREEDLSGEQEQMSDEGIVRITADQEESPEIAPESQGPDVEPEFDRRREETRWEEAVGAAEQKLLDQIAERVEPVYQRALQQYKNKDYSEARRSFEEVQVLSPDYKLTAKYLDGIDDDILYAQQQKEEEQRLAEERARRQDELEFRKTIAAKEAVYRKELTGQAEEIYQQAIEDFKNRSFEEAEDNLRKVETLAPGYKLTGKYLERIQDARDDEARLQTEEDLRRQALMQHNEEADMKRTIEESERMRQQGLREKAEAIYQKARTDYGQGEMEKARAGFSEVEQILPDYRSARKYLVFIDDMAGEQKRKLEVSPQSEEVTVLTERTKRAVVPASRKRLEAEELYQQAKESYKKREFVKAKELFEQVNTVVRDYQATEKFLARIDSDIQKEARYQQDLQRRDARRQAREKALGQKRAAAAQRRREAQEFTEAARRIKNDRDQMIAYKVQELYLEAESDYASGLYALAKERFTEIQRISPGYRATEEYLGNIAYTYGGEATGETIPVPLRLEREVLPVPAPASVPVVQEQIDLPAEEIVTPKMAAPEAEQQRQFEEQQRALARVIRSEKNARKKVSTEEQKKAQRTKERQEREAANRAAKEKAAEKIARKNQLNIQKAEEKKRARLLARAEQKYAQALAAYTKKDFIGAKQKFVEVEKLSANFKETVQYLSRVDADIAAQNQKPREVIAAPIYVQPQGVKAKEQARMKADVLFREAVHLYAAKQFVPAREKFQEVERLIPGYKTTGKYVALIDRDIARQLEKESRTKQAQDARRARLEANAQRVREKAEKVNQAKENKRVKRLIAQMENEAVTASKRGQWDVAEQKLFGVEELFKGESVSAADKQQAALRVASLRERIVAGRGEEQKRQLDQEQATKQRQDARTARLEADEQRERAKVGKVRQEVQSKQQAQLKRVPASVPAARSVWVDPPNFDDFELTEDIGTLRRQYARVRKERKGVQGAIRVRLDQTYAQAVQLYNQGSYAGAKNLFQEIAGVQPSFRGTKNYLTQIDQKLAKLPVSAVIPGKGIEAPSVYVKPRARVVADALDSLEAPRP